MPSCAYNTFASVYQPHLLLLGFTQKLRFNHKNGNIIRTGGKSPLSAYLPGDSYVSRQIDEVLLIQLLLQPEW